jgi:phenylacetate-coenzyme A ligase PaaK-like adenylate-forming protein
MPLVRYATGDWARFRRDPCGCGLDGPALEIMEGRDNEIIKGVEGRRFGNAVFAEAAKCAVYRTGCDALRHLRIVQRGVNDFEVRTNRIENPDGYLAELARATLDHLGHGVRFRHVVASDQEIASLQCGKPGLFTCLC